MFDEQEPALGCGTVADQVEHDRGHARRGAESRRMFLPRGYGAIACEQHENRGENLNRSKEGTSTESTPRDWVRSKPSASTTATDVAM